MNPLPIVKHPDCPYRCCDGQDHPPEPQLDICCEGLCGCELCHSPEQIASRLPIAREKLKTLGRPSTGHVSKPPSQPS